MIRAHAVAVGLMAALEASLHETGADIVEATQANMVEGNFYWTGLSRDADTTGPAPDAAKGRAEEEAGDHVGTVYEKLSTDHGEVRVQTPWAAYAELGTVDREAHPALMPAINSTWPSAIERHFSEHSRGV